MNYCAVMLKSTTGKTKPYGLQYTSGLIMGITKFVALNTSTSNTIQQFGEIFGGAPERLREDGESLFASDLHALNANVPALDDFSFALESNAFNALVTPVLWLVLNISGVPGLGFQPEFAEPLDNLTVAVGRDATFRCLVQHLGGYRVSCFIVSLRSLRFTCAHHSFGLPNPAQEDSVG